jgi:ribose transport system permease protein
VLGGTSLSGGKGGVGKTFLGWLVISILSNALILLGFDSNYQLVFKGLVILLAVILDKNFAFLAKLKKWKNKLF